MLYNVNDSLTGRGIFGNWHFIVMSSTTLEYIEADSKEKIMFTCIHLKGNYTFCFIVYVHIKHIGLHCLSYNVTVCIYVYTNSHMTLHHPFSFQL